MVLGGARGIDYTTVDHFGAFGVDLCGIGSDDLGGDFADEVHGLLIALDGFGCIGRGIGVLAGFLEVILAEGGNLFDIGVLKVELQTFIVAIIIHGWILQGLNYFLHDW